VVNMTQNKVFLAMLKDLVQEGVQVCVCAVL
jgi:hypothetical protein